MGLTDEIDVLVADNEKDFAQEIVRLYNDKSLWEKLSSNSRTAIRQYSPESVQEKIAEIMNNLQNVTKIKEHSVNF